MATWALRSIAWFALLALGGLGMNRVMAQSADDSDPPPRIAGAAYTVEARPAPIGPSIVQAPQADEVRATSAGKAPAGTARPARQPMPQRPMYRPVADTRRPPRLAQQRQPEVIPPATAESSAQMESSAPIESDVEMEGPVEHAPGDWSDHLMANGPDAVGYSSGEWMQDGCWFFQADLVLMNRVNPQSRILTVDTTAPRTDFLSPAPFMSTSDNSFNIAPGGRATIGHYVGRDWANRDQSVECTFMGLFDWDKTSGIESSFPQRLYTPMDPGFLFLPDDVAPIRNATIGGFAAADRQDIQYNTNLNSLELNLRSRYRLGRDMMTAMPDGTWTRQLEPGPTPSLMAGLRYIRINESFDWHSVRFNNPALGNANLGNATGDYDIETSNDLFGIQVGGDFRRESKDFSVGGWIKFGGLVNWANQRSVVVVDDNFFSGDINSEREASQTVLTFAGEAGLDGAYHLNPNVSVRGGFEILWIQAVAVATEQIDFELANPPIVDLAGNIFYMGAHVGLEVVW